MASVFSLQILTSGLSGSLSAASSDLQSYGLPHPIFWENMDVLSADLSDLNISHGLELDAEGYNEVYAVRMDLCQLDSALYVPRRPPDPRIIVVNFIVFHWKRNFCHSLSAETSHRLSVILYPHGTISGSWRPVFLPPTDDPDLDRSTVALDAWGCLPIGSGDGINDRAGLGFVDLWLGYPDLF